MILIPDNSHVEQINTFYNKFTKSPDGRIRIDRFYKKTLDPIERRLMTNRPSGHDVYIKATHIGHEISGRSFSVTESVFHESDAMNGNTLLYYSLVEGERDIKINNPYRGPKEFLNIYGRPSSFSMSVFSYGQIENDIDINIVYNEDLMRDNRHYTRTIDVFEENFQVSYFDILMNVDIGLSTGLSKYPFSMIVILDSELGMDVKNIWYLKDGTLGKLTEVEVLNYLSGLERVYKVFKHGCRKENVKLRVHAHIGVEGLSYEVFHNKQKHKFIGRLSNVDLSRIVKTCDASYPTGLISGDLMGELCSRDKNPELLVNTFQDIDDQREFLGATYSIFPTRDYYSSRI